ncbi:TonB-dependent Fe(3+) dicitrate receptor FecA [Pseudomonas schmalbachii]|uniref:Fe(3+) dicitrate transport protein FecA n=1 Tax=Pseudomonas schmalbachii TaxID=2816993 RepID=A0ABS3TN76_9PSED|nr:TonB-dependent Fe(3+) dicitrate receptor FecA [Pseudomonas schmalbachii]MBO3275112.1 Fe(3+) dicitrate transport protein FecA [Pseudomonas schmalbachii]
MSSSRALSPLSRALLLACLGGVALAPAVAFGATEISSARQYYRIPAEPLEQALNHLGQKAGVLIAFSPEQTAGRRSQPLDGEYTAAEALAALLAGSGLEAQPQEDGAFTLQVAASEEPADLQAVTVVGDWLADASAVDVFEHPGARDVVRREQFQAQGAATTREVLDRIPGVSAPLNNGTGSHDLALNFGIRGLNPRLASRSTVLMDGIPVPFAPYGQPQLSLAPVSMGNMDAVDVVRGGGAVRYGPQNVGGIVNFVTRAIPDEFTTHLDVHTEQSPDSTHDGLKTTHSALIGGTADNGLGGALLYSGVRGGDWREHSDTRIDDLILKGRFQPNEFHSFSAITQYYDGEADMPGGLSVADYRDDPYQSTRPFDKFWGRRTLASASYEFTPNAQQKLNVTGFFTKTLRSGYLDQGKNLTLSPREYWVRGLETRFSQGFELGETRHEVGIGHRYVNEASHELRYWSPASSGILPSTGSPNDRDTRGATEANAFYIDDRIDVGNWTITPGIRYEKIDSHQDDLIKNTRDSGRYNASLPALNVIYHLDPRWNLYANTEGSFGTVQYSQMGKAVKSGDIEPEEARTWEVGTRYDDGILRAELGVFLINFDKQYESNQQTDSVTARGKTRHKGIEAAIGYDLAALDPLLSGFDVYASYAYVDASIREDGPNKGNQVPFSSKHKGTLGANYRNGPWGYNLDGSFQTSQYADNANTEAESADGSTGRIAGWMVWSARGSYDFGPQLNGLELSAGVKNLFDRRYYTRSFDDNNKGLYVGQPRTLYVQASVGF